jgi:hypothetical protein
MSFAHKSFPASIVVGLIAAMCHAPAFAQNNSSFPFLQQQGEVIKPQMMAENALHVEDASDESPEPAFNPDSLRPRQMQNRSPMQPEALRREANDESDRSAQRARPLPPQLQQMQEWRQGREREAGRPNFFQEERTAPQRPESAQGPEREKSSFSSAPPRAFREMASQRRMAEPPQMRSNPIATQQMGAPINSIVGPQQAAQKIEKAPKETQAATVDPTGQSRAKPMITPKKRMESRNRRYIRSQDDSVVADRSLRARARNKVEGDPTGLPKDNIRLHEEDDYVISSPQDFRSDLEKRREERRLRRLNANQ